MQTALAEGASYFLQKPYTTEDLEYIWQHVYKFNAQTSSKKTNSSEEPPQSFQSENNQQKQALSLLKRKNIVINDNCEQQEGGDKDKKKISRSNESMSVKAMAKEMEKEMEMDVEVEMNNEISNKSGRNRRHLWTPELHRKFTHAVSLLGDKSMTLILSLHFIDVFFFHLF